MTTHVPRLLAVVGLTVALAIAQDAPSTSKVETKGRVPISNELLHVQLPRPVTARLANGMRIVVVEDHRLPLANAILSISGAGPLFEPRERAGLASLTAQMLSEGTRQRDSRELAVAGEKVGATIAAQSDFGSPDAQVTVSALGENITQWLPLLAEMVLHPSFPADEFTSLKQRSVLNLRRQRSQPEFLARERLARTVFGSHPAAVTGATPESLAPMERDLLVQWHAQRYRPQNAILGVSGNVNGKQVIALAQKYFAEWQKNEFTATLPAEPVRPTARKLFLIDRPGSVQTTILLGNIAVDRRHPDYLAVMLANRILGEGPSGRLFINLREVHGWTYGAYSSIRAGAYSGPWSASTNVRTDVTDGAMTEFLSEVRRLSSEPVPEAELRQAQRAFVASFALSLENPQRLLQYYLDSAIYGFPDDYWDSLPVKVMAITAADIQRVAARYLNPDAIQIVAVGDGAKISSILRKHGSVETYSPEGQPLDER